MNGYQLTFFTQQDRMHRHQPLAQWIVEEAGRLGLRGATLNGAIEGMGHDGRLHSISLIDLSEQPVQVTLVVSTQECDRLFERLVQERIKVFYLKTKAEFGMLGESSND